MILVNDISLSYWYLLELLVCIGFGNICFEFSVLITSSKYEDHNHLYVP